jgi:hypothetical protein
LEIIYKKLPKIEEKEIDRLLPLFNKLENKKFEKEYEIKTGNNLLLKDLDNVIII